MIHEYHGDPHGKLFVAFFGREPPREADEKGCLITCEKITC
ncbi:MAG: hypothetical protein ABIP39_12300 [Polyangiaceae bacterium]